MLFPTRDVTCVHSSICVPFGSSLYNQTSLLLMLGLSTDTRSLVVGTAMLKSANSKDPCLNIKKKPTLGLPGPLPSFL